MKSISVLIPTASHPKLLETALESVARQTAIERIEEVLVSENLKDRESETVCQRFKELPIRYIFQDPTLSKVQHFNYLYDQAQAEFVALLCDDDWWGPGHLEGALRALNKHTDATAWASACLHAPGDTPWTGMMSRSPLLWLIAGRPGVCETWRLSREQILAAAWIQTPFHISTLVMRRRVLKEVVPFLTDLHSYQDDRMLQVHLGARGPMLYEPVVDTCVRAHAEALSWQFSKAEREEEFRNCTAEIRELCDATGVDVVSLWQQCLVGLSGPILDDAGHVFRMALNEKQLAELGFGQFLLPHPVVRFLKRAGKVLRNRWRAYKPVISKSFGLAGR